ncbi:MAG: hypothetical protein R3E01_27140 [Pirellulaceae bacterium]
MARSSNRTKPLVGGKLQTSWNDLPRKFFDLSGKVDTWGRSPRSLGSLVRPGTAQHDDGVIVEPVLLSLSALRCSVEDGEKLSRSL